MHFKKITFINLSLYLSFVISVSVYLNLYFFIFPYLSVSLYLSDTLYIFLQILHICIALFCLYLSISLTMNCRLETLCWWLSVRRRTGGTVRSGTRPGSSPATTSPRPNVSRAGGVKCPIAMRCNWNQISREAVKRYN